MREFQTYTVIYILFILLSFDNIALADNFLHNSEKVYDAVIVGGGISGLTAAYMLRDKNILLLEKDKRFGGRVWSEKVDGVWYNIGTQYLIEEDDSFIKLLDELGIKRTLCSIEDVPIAAYLGGKFYKDLLDIPLSFKEKVDCLKVVSLAYRKMKIFKLPPEDPRWQELASKNLADLFKCYDPDVMRLFYAYLKGACITKPENTSAGIGVMLMGDIFNVAPFSFVEEGTQKVTDTMVEKLQGRLINEALVKKVEEKDGFVYTFFQKNGKEHIVKSKKAILATPAPITLSLIPDAPSWKKDALAKTKYGSIITVNIFLKEIPWERFSGMLVEGKIFSGAIDATYDIDFTLKDNEHRSYPKILSFFISIPPEDLEEQKVIFSKSDEEIVGLVIQDFESIMSEPTFRDYILDSRVTRFPIGEVGITPEYFIELLPLLEKPVGNIHFCGDYTDRSSFLMGSVLSGFRVARELGSTLVVSEEEEIRFAESSLWGKFGWISILLNTVLLLFGLSLRFMKVSQKKFLKKYGMLLSILGLVMLIVTLLFPYFMPPHQIVYQMLLLLTLAIVIVGFFILMLLQLIIRNSKG